MKVLLAIPGHLKTVPMGRFTAEALQELGHDVVLFDFHASALDKVCDRIRKSEEEKTSVNRRLRRSLERFRPDIFITLFGFDISLESLSHMRRLRIPTACWWINDPFQYERSIKKAPYYDFVFSNSEVCASQYRERGVRKAYFLPTACAPAVHRPVASEVRYRSEVCFAGDWSPLREQLMERLVDRFDLKIFGPWGDKMKSNSPLRARLADGFFSPAGMAAMFSSAAVVINLHTWFGKFGHGVNPRLFEAAGCASYQLVDWKQEIPKLFDCPREMVCYRRLDEVPDLISSALSDRDAARATASAAQQRAYRDHTYRNRMQTLIELVGKAGG